MNYIEIFFKSYSSSSTSQLHDFPSPLPLIIFSYHLGTIITTPSLHNTQDMILLHHLFTTPSAPSIPTTSIEQNTIREKPFGGGATT